MWLNYITVLHLNHVCPPNVTEICTRVPVTYVPTWSMVGCKTRMSNASGFSLQGLHLLWLPPSTKTGRLGQRYRSQRGCSSIRYYCNIVLGSCLTTKVHIWNYSVKHLLAVTSSDPQAVRTSSGVCSVNS